MPTKDSGNPVTTGGSEDLGQIRDTQATQRPEPSVPQTLARMYRNHSLHVLGFSTPVAHFGKRCYVDLYAFDPVTGKKRRKVYRLDHVKGAVARKARARDLVDRLNEKLRVGWNPFSKMEAPKSMHSLRDACDQYVAFKARTTRNRTPMYYASHKRRFCEWCEMNGLLDAPVGQFTRSNALRYLDHVRETRSENSETYNNYHLFGSVMFNWFVEREYRTSNPFHGVRRMRRVEKFRTLITPDERTQALEWFAQHDPSMVMVCMWVFHTLLRPRSEMMRIRVKDIDLMNGVVNVDGRDSKSSRIRRPAIPKAMMPYLLASPVMQAEPNDYVCGKGSRPGPVKSGYNYIGMQWNRMRDSLGWSKDKQLYSMRDSGIVQLIADGVDLNVVMRQAGHRDISTTNRYVQHYFPNSIRQVQEKATPFSSNPLTAP